MTSLDIQLLLTALASVLVLVALIVSRIKLHPLLALLIVSVGSASPPAWIRKPSSSS